MSNVIWLKAESSAPEEQTKGQKLAQARTMLIQWSEAARALKLLYTSIKDYRNAAELLPGAQEKRAIQTEIDDLELLFLGLLSQLTKAAEQTVSQTKTLLASLEKPLQVMPKD